MHNQQFELLALLNKGKSEFRIENTLPEKQSMHLTGVIVNSDPFGFGGIVGSEVVKELDALTSGDVDIYLNSPGGSVFAGVAIAEAIQRCKANVTVNVSGLCASAATFLVMASKNSTIGNMGKFMIHNANAGVQGDYRDCTKMAEILRQTDLQIAEMYALKTGKSIDDMLEMMATETYFTGKQAVEIGFVSALIEPVITNEVEWQLEGQPLPEKTTIDNSKTAPDLSYLKAKIKFKELSCPK